MITAISLPERQKLAKQHIFLGAAYLAALVLAAKDYLDLHAINVQLGLLALLICGGVNRDREASSQFAITAIIFAALAWLITVKTFVYASVLCGCLFMVESYAGRINRLVPVILVLTAPVFDYFTNVFTFPIRLGITEIAGSILSATGINTSTSGNMIICNGQNFSVDPECMGLKMMVTSLLAALMLAALWQKQMRRQLGYLPITLLLGCTFLLNIISNLMRIIALVYFAIPAGSVMHDLTGLVCMALYTLLPSFLYSRWLVKSQGKEVKNMDSHRSPKSERGVFLLNLLVLVLATVVTIKLYTGTQAGRVSINTKAEGYQQEQLQFDVLKLQNSHALVYIKPIAGFYATDHHPMICWKGSGYSFHELSLQQRAGAEFYTATLVNNDSKLYTAWWYDNAEKSFAGQSAWRWDILIGGRNYSLVNITCGTKELLMQEIEAFKKQQVMKQLMRVERAALRGG